MKSLRKTDNLGLKKNQSLSIGPNHPDQIYYGMVWLDFTHKIKLNGLTFFKSKLII